jgi:methylated-DNA-[protein]-cysteine S-methyltransferase
VVESEVVLGGYAGGPAVKERLLRIEANGAGHAPGGS